MDGPPSPEGRSSDSSQVFRSAGCRGCVSAERLLRALGTGTVVVLGRYCVRHRQTNIYPVLVIPVLVGSRDSHQIQGLESITFNKRNKPHTII